jgi:hypothetical protein
MRFRRWARRSVFVLAHVEAVRGIGDAIYLVYRIIPGAVYKTPGEKITLSRIEDAAHLA